MTRIGLRRLLGSLACMTALALAAGCGGGDEERGTASFCDQVREVVGDGGETTAQEFSEGVEKLRKIDPPDAIADDWQTVMDAYDPDAKNVDAAKVQAAGKRLQPYIEKECRIAE